MFRKTLLTLIFATVAANAAAQTPEQRATVVTSREEALDLALAKEWNLKPDEWARYRHLMRGPLGTWSPGLDPLTALGIEARSDAERQRYAELQVKMESIRVEKLLAYQRAFDAAWARLYPGLPRIATPGAMVGDPKRLALFVTENCPACEKRVKQLQAAGTGFDLYLVGSQNDDARIRRWAKKAGVDPARVKARDITLNHDAGRWAGMGVTGALPALVREENGRWQRILP
jgi:integrating conjugative element protein (TIGR03759 family)